MSSAPKHTARSIVEAFYEAERIYTIAAPEDLDFSIIAATLSSDVYLEQSSGLPYAGTYRGPEGIQQWVQKAGEWFSKIDVKEPEFFEREGSNRIAVLSTVNFRVRATGEELFYPMAQSIKVDLEKGVISEIRPFYWDVHHLNKALGYTPEP